MKMVYYSTRKSCRLIKICAFLTFTSGFLVLWLNNNKSLILPNDLSTVEKGFSSLELEYERQIQEDEARIVPGLADGGVPVFLEGVEKELGEESYKKYAINVYLSDRIPYNRQLPDSRMAECARERYDAQLPSASVVIAFHDEPFSVLVRTVRSIVDSVRRDQPWYHNTKTGGPVGYPGQAPSSRHVYVREILLVDDASSAPALLGLLHHYVRTRLPHDLVNILRLPQRVGLIRARMSGARAARGDVLVFMDAHCEVVRDWLRPLLQRVKHSRTAVVLPTIDTIDEITFDYGAQPNDIQVAVFTFWGDFMWIDIPQRELIRRGSNIAPTWSPTMAGGLYAMDRMYFWQLGGYDEQMDGWGGENLEMSFRVWQCGGTLEAMPCSRVGHVFRAFQPYKLHKDTFGINTARMAEVWMDEYAELFFLFRPDLRKNWAIIGNVEERRALRKRLHCRSFQWYLDHVYPEMYIAIRDAIGFGRFRNPSTGLCLDTLQRIGTLGVFPCHDTLTPSQDYSLTLGGKLRNTYDCAEIEYFYNYRQGNYSVQEEMACVTMVRCDKVSQKTWRYLRSRQLQHTRSGLCLDAGLRNQASENGTNALVRACRPAAPSQAWLMEYTQEDGFWGLREGTSQEHSENIKRLLALRKKPGLL